MVWSLSGLSLLFPGQTGYLPLTHHWWGSHDFLKDLVDLKSGVWHLV